MELLPVYILIGIYIIVAMSAFFYLISNEFSEDSNILVLFLYLLAALFWPVLLVFAIFEDY